jgi:hypothetical protein
VRSRIVFFGREIPLHLLGTLEAEPSRLRLGSASAPLSCFRAFCSRFISYVA